MTRNPIDNLCGKELDFFDLQNDIPLAFSTHMKIRYGTNGWWVIDPAFIEQKRPERKVKKEEELSAGDTRLLDEFLNGFIQNGS